MVWLVSALLPAYLPLPCEGGSVTFYHLSLKRNEKPLYISVFSFFTPKKKDIYVSMQEELSGNLSLLCNKTEQCCKYPQNSDWLKIENA